MRWVWDEQVHVVVFMPIQWVMFEQAVVEKTRWNTGELAWINEFNRLRKNGRLRGFYTAEAANGRYADTTRARIFRVYWCLAPWCTARRGEVGEEDVYTLIKLYSH